MYFEVCSNVEKKSEIEGMPGFLLRTSDSQKKKKKWKKSVRTRKAKRETEGMPGFVRIMSLFFSKVCLDCRVPNLL